MADRITIAIEPLDAVFFGDGRSFSAGETTDTASVFPPSPFSIQGMVRTTLLHRHCGRLTTYARGCQASTGARCDRFQECGVRHVVGVLKGDQGSAGSLRVRGPWLVLIKGPTDVVHLLPAPLDLVREGGSASTLGDVKTASMVPIGDDKAASNFPGCLRPLTLPPGKTWASIAPVGGWVSWPAYNEYLRSRELTLKRGENWWAESDLYVRSRRTGIAIDPTARRTKSGYFYIPEMITFQSAIVLSGGEQARVALGVSIEGLGSLGASGLANTVVALGGERRAAAVQPISEAPWDAGVPVALLEKSARIKGMKLVWQQPAWLERGWIPSGWSCADGTTDRPGLKWIAMRSERPVRLGGWDLAANDARPMRLFLPAGSTAYLSIEDSVAREALVESLWNKPMNDQPPGETLALSDVGFGRVLVGLWTNEPPTQQAQKKKGKR